MKGGSICERVYMRIWVCVCAYECEVKRLKVAIDTAKRLSANGNRLNYSDR